MHMLSGPRLFWQVTVETLPLLSTEEPKSTKMKSLLSELSVRKTLCTFYHYQQFWQMRCSIEGSVSGALSHAITLHHCSLSLSLHVDSSVNKQGSMLEVSWQGRGLMVLRDMERLEQSLLHLQQNGATLDFNLSMLITQHSQSSAIYLLAVTYIRIIHHTLHRTGLTVESVVLQPCQGHDMISLVCKMTQNARFFHDLINSLFLNMIGWIGNNVQNVRKFLFPLS